MKRRSTIGLSAIGAVAALVLAACGSGGGSSGGSSGGASASAYNKAITSVVNSSSTKGGTITYALSNVPDSTDPGNTYYAYNWNFTRLYATPLMTYQSCPGTCGLNLVPGLATGPGVQSANGLTWTYHIKPNVYFSDGQLVTSQDVKYAVERSFAKSVLVNGPSYFQVLLAPQKPAYTGPYTDKADGDMALQAVQTPNSTTIVFHLAQRFADFNYVVAIPQTAPVPPNKDTGAQYQTDPISTGPYMISSYQLNKQYTLVPNPHWSASDDTQVKQLASKIIVLLNVNAQDIDNRTLAGDVQVNMAGTGVQAATRGRILLNKTLKADADDPTTGFEWFAYLNTKVAPLNNLHCREAVEYAADKTTLQDAYGGPVLGGDIASTAMPPNIIGYKSFDDYKALSDPSGDLTDAKKQLSLCGHPNGFTIGLGYRSDRPTETAAAQALQAGLARAGINAQLKGFPSGSYYSTYAGVPAYVHSHDLGIDMGGWGADFPDAWGWFDELYNGNAIATAGNTNIAELSDPLVNSLLGKFQLTLNAATRNTYTTEINQQIMKDAAVLPIVYSKALDYRPPNLTNVYVQDYYGMYNYGVIGTKP
jgi:peptide/nickel transport system substrate-binding protein